MTADMSFWRLFLDATLLVKLIMIGLLCLSLISWTVIFQRICKLRKTSREMKQFEDQFWSGTELSRLYEAVSEHKAPLVGLAAIFHAGFREFVRLRKQLQGQSHALLQGTSRAMNIVLAKERDKLEAHLSFLATVGSVSPFIGLFGTVWGIMHSFIALGNAQQATLAMVAPGIAEALVATAMGLFAAIPAVVAYNRLNHQAGRLIGQYENFIDELSNILHRQITLSADASLNDEVKAPASGGGI